MKSFFQIFCFFLIGIFSFSSSSLSLNAIEKTSLSEILEIVYLQVPNLEVLTEPPFHYSHEKLESIEISSSEIKKNFMLVKKEKCEVPAEIPVEIKNDFAKAIENIPCELLQSLRTVEIFDDPEKIFPRAMANGRILKIRSDAINEPEFIKVLLHELGHVVDLGGLSSKKFEKKSPYKDGQKIIYADDVSILFYEISWENELQKKSGITNLDFVGGYASLDMFEDYAESFLMYIEHGNSFRILATKNKILQKKYDFFRDYVFNGKEFFTGSYKVNFDKREWDITKY